jgi:hypothetical protein
MKSNRSNLSRRDFVATTAASVAATAIMGAGCIQQNKRVPAKTLGMCGLDCVACPAFLAYTTNDQALRVKTAIEWTRQFNVPFKPEDINCVGCLKADGIHVGHCSQCEIRACGQKHKVANCALCPDYASCDTINKFITNVPPAKANLEEVGSTR